MQNSESLGNEAGSLFVAPAQEPVGKEYTQGLYALKNTKAPALLVECCFVDNQNDYNHWNAEKCGDAIASAIAGKKIQGSGAAAPTPKPAMPTAKPNAAFDPEGWVRRRQAERNRQGFSDQPVDGVPLVNFNLRLRNFRFV